MRMIGIISNLKEEEIKAINDSEILILEEINRLDQKVEEIKNKSLEIRSNVDGAMSRLSKTIGIIQKKIVMKKRIMDMNNIFEFCLKDLSDKLNEIKEEDRANINKLMDIEENLENRIQELLNQLISSTNITSDMIAGVEKKLKESQVMKVSIMQEFQYTKNKLN
jgi:hypothetical protein